MGNLSRRRSAQFKFSVVLESIQKNAVAEVARQYSVHPNQLTKWRQEFRQRGARIFELQTGEEGRQLKRHITGLGKMVREKETEIRVLRGCLVF
jgi:transposase-like protein